MPIEKSRWGRTSGRTTGRTSGHLIVKDTAMITHPTRHTKTAHRSNIPLYAPGVAKPVAFVNPQRRLLYKMTRHFMRVPPGIAFDDDVLRQAGELGAVDIEVTDGASPHRDTYRCTLDTFLRHAEVVNRGHGRQLVLRFSFWRKNGQPSEVERQAEQQAARAEAAGVVQLDLFGGGE